jgi:hypothetical protein
MNSTVTLAPCRRQRFVTVRGTQYNTQQQKGDKQ